MLPTIDLSDLADELARLGDEIQRTYEDSEQGVEPAPQVPLSGLAQLLETVRAADTTTVEGPEIVPGPGAADPDALLDHGLALLRQVVEVARRLGLESQARAVEILAVPFACWMVRRGSELQHPEDVVNALGKLADGLRDPEELADLYGLMEDIADGIAADRVQGLDPTDPTDPWVIFLLNRGIVATRSHRPALMEEAFDAIGDQLPERAPDFFREGMGQMETFDYPQPVREVMQRYFDRWCSGQRLH